jgi:hypothetical protein
MLPFPTIQLNVAIAGLILPWQFLIEKTVKTHIQMRGFLFAHLQKLIVESNTYEF